jgi:protein SCO1/2
MAKSKTLWAVLLLLSMLLLAFTTPLLLSWMTHHDYHGRWVNEAAPEFQIMTQQGPSPSLADFRGQTVFLYFGYLHCDGFCQHQWVTLFHVMQTLKNEPVKAVLISLDPQRDSVEAFATLASNLGANFVAISGQNLTEIQMVANLYHQPFSKLGAWQKNDYKIDHTGDIFMISSQGDVKLVYSGNKHLPEQIVADYWRLLKAGD